MIVRKCISYTMDGLVVFTAIVDAHPTERASGRTA